MSGSGHRVDFGGGSGIDTALVDVTYFFQPVEDAVGPYAIAPFLSRSSSLTVTAQRTETTQIVSFRFPPEGERVSHEMKDGSDRYSVGGRHVWRETGWYVGGGLHYHEPDDVVSSSSELDIDEDGYTVIAGKYLQESTALELMFHSTRLTRDSASLVSG